MKTRFVVWTGLVLVVALQFIVRPVAQDAGVRALYDRAESLNRRTQNLIYNVAETPQWVQGSPTSSPTADRSRAATSSCWSIRRRRRRRRRSTTRSSRRRCRRRRARSTRRSRCRSTPSRSSTTARRSSSRSAPAAPDGQGGGAGAGRQGGGAPAAPRWRCTLTDYTCTRATAAPADQAAARGQGRAGGQGAGRGAGAGAGANATANVRASPDGKWEALIQNFNVFVRPARRATQRRLHAQHRRLGRQRLHLQLAALVAGLEEDRASSPPSRLRPARALRRVVARRSAAAETLDELLPQARRRRRLRSAGRLRRRDEEADARRHRAVPESVREQRSSRGAATAARSRSNTTSAAISSIASIEVDATTGKHAHADRRDQQDVRRVLRQDSYSRRRRHDGKEIIWTSERDGWNHLYLYDGVTGQVKNQITKGTGSSAASTTSTTTKRQIYVPRQRHGRRARIRTSSTTTASTSTAPA